MTDPKLIRNFSIIAHIDHGKSTLADRLLEYTKTVDPRKMQAQFLDKMDLERERGITIKAQTVRMHFKSKDGKDYILNLIDTPGHVDFTYEVSRSLAACEGAVLVVDVSQGVEAQTLANVNLALNNKLQIIPVLNKIDLPGAQPDKVKEQIEEVLTLDASDALPVSAKEGTGVPELLEAIVERLPAPRDGSGKPLSALVFDSWYDAYRGVIGLIRVRDGQIKKGEKIKLWHTGREYEVLGLGVFSPDLKDVSALSSGEVGVVIAGIKTIEDLKVGDTITHALHPCAAPLEGFREAKPMVFSGLYPVDSDQYDELRDALQKLRLNDSALHFEPETSQALGFGFRCGYLGLLHMEIVKERLEREFNLELIVTAPSVVYHVTLRNKQGTLDIENPAHFPDPGQIEYIEEPMIRAVVYTPTEYLGNIFKACQDRRGKQVKIEYLSGNRALITYDLPLNEVVFGFFDQVKSVSRGYASFEYELQGYQQSDLLKMDIMLNGEVVDALSVIVHSTKAYSRGRELCKKLKEHISRHMFEIAIQAALGGKIIARETLGAMRKNVTAKCYGGDITRKRKLLEKQKEGKKRMKQMGSVEVPQEAFLALLKIEE